MDHELMDWLVVGLCRRMTTSLSLIDRLNNAAEEFIRTHEEAKIHDPKTWSDWERFVLPLMSNVEVLSLKL